MSERDDETPAAHPGNVPQLIDTYKSQREALRAQSRDLLRLQNEIRSAADREATDIVNAARADVRRVLVNARRELLVLAAQVQAAIDEPALGEEGDATRRQRMLAEAARVGLTDSNTQELETTHELLLEARQNLHAIVDDVKPELTALSDEARVLRASLSRNEPPPALGPVPVGGSTRQEHPFGPRPVLVPRAFAANEASAATADEPFGFGAEEKPAAPANQPFAFGAGEASAAKGDAPFAFATDEEPAPALDKPFTFGADEESATPADRREFPPMRGVTDAPPLEIAQTLEEAAARQQNEPYDQSRDRDALSAAPLPGLIMPAGRQAPVLGVRRDTSRPSLRLFVGTFAVLGATVVAGTAWWIRSAPETPRETAPAAAGTSADAPQPAQPAASPEPAAAANVPPAPGTINLTVEARRDVWLRATVDGRGDQGGLMRAGESREITGARDVTLRAGDAGAVWVGINGGVPERLGRDGEVLTRRYPAAPPAGSAAPAGAADGGSSGAPELQSALPPLNAGSTRPFDGAQDQANVTREPVAPSRPPVTGTTPAVPAAPPEPAAAQPVASETSRPVADAAGPERELGIAAELWFDAYHRGSTLTAFGARQQPTVSDERGSAGALPPGSGGLERTFDGVRLQLVGDNALYTARMTERAQLAGRTVQQVSLVSQVWMRRDGVWRLLDVRLVNEARVNR